jgi:hypothetical protein
MVKHLVSGIPILDACVGKVVESEKKKKLWCRDKSTKLQFYAARSGLQGGVWFGSNAGHAHA